jgi:hypothetical protein
MRRKPEGWNIILAGFWNRLIFTPEWVAEHVFHHANFETYVALLPVLPIVFNDKVVSMEVSLARLVFRPMKLEDDAALARAEEMARDVLKALPETPVQAVGVNFSYVEDFPPDHLAAVFNDNDPRDLGMMGWETKERRLTRRLTQGGDTLNLTMSNDGKSVTFDLNFHTDATTNDAASRAVRSGRAADLRRQGLELIQDVYHLEIEEGGDDDNV